MSGTKIFCALPLLVLSVTILSYGQAVVTDDALVPPIPLKNTRQNDDQLFMRLVLVECRVLGRAVKKDSAVMDKGGRHDVAA